MFNNYSDLIMSLMTLTICLALPIIFVYAGKPLTNPSLGKTNSLILQWSASITLGFALFIFVLMTTEKITSNFRVSLLVSLISLLLFGYFAKTKNENHVDSSIKNTITFYLMNFILLILILLIGMQVPIPLIDIENLHPGGTVTMVAHSLRAGNIAIYVDEFNTIPTFNQNYAQSILAAIPSTIGLRTPQLSLAIWRGISLLVVIGLTYSIFRYWLLKRTSSAIVASVVTIFANTAFNKYYVTVVDAGSTLFFVRSVDSLLAICMAIVTFYFIVSAYNCSNSITVQKRAIFSLNLFILGFAFNAVGAHYIVIFLLAFILCLFFYFIQVRQINNLIVICCASFFLGSSFGVLSGGMLAPKSIVETPFIPGLLTFNKLRVQDNAVQLIQFRGLYFNAYTPPIPKYTSSLKNVEDKRKPDHISVLYDKNFSWTIFLRSLTFIFTPLIGLIFSSLIIYEPVFLNRSPKKSSIVTQVKYPLEKVIQFNHVLKLALTLSWVIFAFGGFISFATVIGGYSWATTRFFQFSVFVGVVCFSYSVTTLPFWIGKFRKRIFLVIASCMSILLVLISLFGSVGYLITLISNSALPQFFSADLWENGGRISTLVRSNQAACGGWFPEVYQEKEKDNFCRER